MSDETYLLVDNLVGTLLSGKGEWSIPAGTRVAVTKRIGNQVWVRDNTKFRNAKTIVVHKSTLARRIKHTREEDAPQGERVYVVVNERKQIVMMYRTKKSADTHAVRSLRQLGVQEWYVIPE